MFSGSKYILRWQIKKHQYPLTSNMAAKYAGWQHATWSPTSSEPRKEGNSAIWQRPQTGALKSKGSEQFCVQGKATW